MKTILGCVQADEITDAMVAAVASVRMERHSRLQEEALATEEINILKAKVKQLELTADSQSQNQQPSLLEPADSLEAPLNDEGEWPVLRAPPATNDGMMTPPPSETLCEILQDEPLVGPGKAEAWRDLVIIICSTLNFELSA